MTMTIAEKIAERYNNDGMTWEDEKDIYLNDLCEELCSYVEFDVPWENDQKEGQFTYVYYFADDSYIAMTEETWDIPNDNDETHDNCKIIHRNQ
tara:strand:- start:166 stop:447 length:282 start_codon:yes stop_codon:yes gene_type:complete